jgi:hypothetical protein
MFILFQEQEIGGHIGAAEKRNFPTENGPAAV